MMADDHHLKVVKSHYPSNGLTDRRREIWNDDDIGLINVTAFLTILRNKTAKIIFENKNCLQFLFAVKAGDLQQQISKFYRKF